MKKKDWLIRSKSFLAEVPIETVKSEWSKGLSVSMVKGRYQLFTDKVIYSWEDLYKNFRITINKLKSSLFKPKKVLVLGLGLGSVIQIVEKKFKQHLEFTAVELDPAVLYLIHKYASGQFRSPVEFIQADAHAFVLQNTLKYDLILFDIFIDDLVPPQFEALSFIKKMSATLNPCGLLLFNRIAVEPDHILHNMHFYEHVFRKVFPQAAFIDVKVNWILVSDGKLLKK